MSCLVADGAINCFCFFVCPYAEIRKPGAEMLYDVNLDFILSKFYSVSLWKWSAPMNSMFDLFHFITLRNGVPNSTLGDWIAQLQFMVSQLL